MLNGNTVTLHRPTITYDADHDKVKTYTTETIPNVLIAPGKTSDVDEGAHDDGAEVIYTLGFPKTWQFQSVKGCLVTLPAPWSTTGKVIGDPQPNDLDNCPTDWYCTIELEAYDG